MSGLFQQRVAELKEVLEGPRINLNQVRDFCFQGVPDKPGLRALSWRILLNYLPLDKSKWKSFLDKERNLYETYVNEVIVQASSNAAPVDHPLSLEPDSQWQTFFKDNEVLLQIDRDVRRLCPDISFFQHPTVYPANYVSSPERPCETLRMRVERAILKAADIGTNRLGLRNVSLSLYSRVLRVSLKKLRSEEYVPLQEGQEAHWEVVERMLFIYAKLNPGVGYVQGMNEIMGPIYYVFASDPNKEWHEHAEADAFFCFTHLMGEIKDYFQKTLDDSAFGIGNMMLQLYDLLKVSDLELSNNLEKKNIKPQFFAFRWITLLLSQEFNLPDVIRLWDSLFSDSNRFDFLIHVCCAMLMLMRDQLIDCDFAWTMKLLQNFPSDDIHMAMIIRKAVELKKPTSTTKAPSGKPQSSRGFNLKQRLSLF
eukprot:gene15915-17515_t